MSVLKQVIVIGAMSVMLAAGPVWAQTPPASKPSQTPPAQTPPAQTTPPATPPAQTAPAAQPSPPRPFPEGARIAYVDIQAVASNSAEGKAATAKIQELNKKKTAELAEKQTALQGLQTKLQQGGTVLSDQARGQLEKDIEKSNREIQFFQQDAQSEIQELTEQLQGEFQQRLHPIIAQIAQEKALHYVFSVRDSGMIWFDTGLDLSAEVIKRFDASAKTSPPAKK
jgi:outer membrane protein